MQRGVRRWCDVRRRIRQEWTVERTLGLEPRSPAWKYTGGLFLSHVRERMTTVIVGQDRQIFGQARATSTIGSCAAGVVTEPLLVRSVAPLRQLFTAEIAGGHIVTRYDASPGIELFLPLAICARGHSQGSSRCRVRFRVMRTRTTRAGLTQMPSASPRMKADCTVMPTRPHSAPRLRRCPRAGGSARRGSAAQDAG